MPRKKATSPADEPIEANAQLEDSQESIAPDDTAAEQRGDVAGEMPHEGPQDTVPMDGTPVAGEELPDESDALMIEDVAYPEEISDEQDGDVAIADSNDPDEPISEVPSDPFLPASLRVRTKKPKPADPENPAPDGNAPSEGSASFPEQLATAPKKRVSQKKVKPPPVLTVESRGEVETPQQLADAAWHGIMHAYLNRRMLTGKIGAIERTESNIPLAIISYDMFRVVIPMKEMDIRIPEGDFQYNKAALQEEQGRILDRMLGAEIDFIIKGVDAGSRSIMASRRDAMLKKRRIFYFDTDVNGMPRVQEGRIVEARVTEVITRAVRVEVFGVEYAIKLSDLSWDWVGNANERYQVGDRVLVRIQKINLDSLEGMSIRADIRSLTSNDGKENLQKCRVQGRYAGQVIDIRKGVVMIRLSIGVNAVAHACYDYRLPGKKDDVSFVVTHIDEERAVAVGIITRIIRQNL